MPLYIYYTMKYYEKQRFCLFVCKNAAEKSWFFVRFS